MGGNLFHLPRMPRTEYLAVEAAMRDHLDRVIPGGYRIPRYYGNKPDFGDLDVLVADRPDWEALRVQIASDLGITQSRRVGHVFSTVFRGLQTDFFTVPGEYLEATYNFMSFNDLGNFLGRMVRRFDLKYGERGLSHVFRRGDGHYKNDLPITTDFAAICAFLGLDHERWRAGFASLESIYEWVIESPFFSVVPYLDETEGELESRKRERTTVLRFVEWLRARGIDRRPDFAERSEYLPFVILSFPEARLDEKIAAERDAEVRAARIAAKFNGKRVIAIRPELSGRALGDFIMAFKASFADFDSFVLDAPEAEIERRIREFGA